MLWMSNCMRLVLVPVVCWLPAITHGVAPTHRRLQSTNPSLTTSRSPSAIPSSMPSFDPTTRPTAIPSDVPSFGPSQGPSFGPSLGPSTTPSALPLTNAFSTGSPLASPSHYPSMTPSTTPLSDLPSSKPTSSSSSAPSSIPRFTPPPTPPPIPLPPDAPVPGPTPNPTGMPSGSPSKPPIASLIPSLRPTLRRLSAAPIPAVSPGPSSKATESPSTKPSTPPSNGPTEYPTRSPINPLITEWDPLQIDLANVPLRSFACDPVSGIEIVSPGPISAGESIAACIRYEGSAGYGVKAVYSANLVGGPNNVNRTLFSAGLKVYSLANVDCSRDGMCVLESNLDFDTFFSGSQPSTITLAGVAVLQLGQQRRQRSLQEQDPPELIGSAFQLQFQLEPPDPMPISSQSGGRGNWAGSSLLTVVLAFVVLLA